MRVVTLLKGIHADVGDSSSYLLKSSKQIISLEIRKRSFA
jgi:hypothetical protein